MTDGRPVRILGRAAGQPGAYLSQFRDSAGRWLVPSLDGVQFQPGDLTGAGTTITVVDTGVDPGHPVIARALVESVDVTGEGPEDRNGHGTMVSLLALRISPDAQLRSIKAFASDGLAPQDQFIAALQRAPAKLGETINVSAGVWQPECQGNCSICVEAKRLTDAGAIVFAAAGNTPGRTDCPAKSDAIAVGAWDIDAGRLAPYSGIGEYVGPVGHWTMVPVDWSE